MIKTYKKINRILTHKDRLAIAGLVVMMFIGGLMELVGVSGIFPLMEIIASGDTSSSKRVISLSVFLICIYILKNIFLLIMYKCIYSFVSKGKARLSTKMMDIYMHEPYEFHLRRNVAVIQRAVRSDTDGVYSVLRDILQILSELIICLILTVVLFYTDFWMALFLTLLVGSCMSLVFVMSKKKISRLGKTEMECSGKMGQWLLQGIGGIKEIKVLNKENYFVSRFDKEAKLSASNNTSQQLYMQMPRLFTETICIIGVLSYIVVSCLMGKDIAVLIPTLAVFAVAAFRLLPSVGKINGYLNDYQFFKPRVDFIIDDIEGMEFKDVDIKIDSQDASVNALSTMTFSDFIKIEDVSFAYQGTEENVLEKVSLTITKNKSFAIVGPSGAGKTTLADIIMGLLKPNNGKVLVDNQDINDNLYGWYNILGYVPQTIYLSDDTIRRNVAFGIEDKDIDETKVKEALKKAQLYDFVEDLDEGLDTVIGDRGVRLSGGQRQRIGIARALYHDPQILILDEATSSLDNETEAAVMEAIDNFKGHITMIIIAHRLSTIENCDEVYRVEDKGCKKIN